MLQSTSKCGLLQMTHNTCVGKGRTKKEQKILFQKQVLDTQMLELQETRRWWFQGFFSAGEHLLLEMSTTACNIFNFFKTNFLPVPAVGIYFAIAGTFWRMDRNDYFSEFRHFKGRWPIQVRNEALQTPQLVFYFKEMKPHWLLVPRVYLVISLAACPASSLLCRSVFWGPDQGV